MKIGYMVGFETEDGWTPITFWKNNVGRWFASIEHSRLPYTTSGAAYIVFTNPVDAKIAWDEATKIDLKYNNSIIAEVDLDPIKQANMSESRHKEYFYHKLTNTREAV